MWELATVLELVLVQLNKLNLEKMKITMKDLEENVGFYSSKASDYCHQLAIAGVVIIWVLYTTHYSKTINGKWLLISAFLIFILTITISIIHYFNLALMADKDFHRNEKVINPKKDKSLADIRKKEVLENPKLELRSWIYFKLKLTVLVLAYALTLLFVVLNLMNF